MSGRVGSITTGIIEDGLIFNMDAANRASYTFYTANSSSYNTVDPTQEGTLTNGVGFLSPPLSASCWDFDGVDDYISTVTLTDLGMAATNTMTVSCWVLFNTLTLYDTVMGASSSPYYSDGFGFFIGSGGASHPIYFFINGSQWSGAISAGMDPLIGDWCHVVGVYDGTLGSNNIKIYLNGILQAGMDDETSNIAGVTETIQIGRIYRNADNCDGNIANAQIYNRALSSNEVLHNYNALKGRFT